MSGPVRTIEHGCTPSSAGKTLDRDLVKGVAWTGAVKWLSQGLSWISTLIVARLLTPSDYGLVAMAMAFLGFVALINEFGLGSAIVMLQKLSPRTVAQLNSLAVLLGAIGFGVACLAAMPLSWFYDVPDLFAVVTVQGLGFIIGAFRSVPGAILEKSRRFKTLALVDGGQAMVSAVATITLAFTGAGYWALVWGNLIGNMSASLTVGILFPKPFLRPVLVDLREVLTFSWHLLATRISWYVASTSDVFVIGRLMGQAALGAYTFGATLANVPLEKVTGLVNRIAPAFYSAVQTDHAALRRYVTGLTEGLALITVPAAIGLALVAEDFVGLVLGEKWNAAIAPLQFLAVYAALRSVSSLLPPLFFLTGGSRIAVFNGIFAVFLFPLGFAIGSRWGIMGVAVAWLVVHPIILVPMYRHVFSAIKLSAVEYVWALWPAFSCAMVMALGVILVRMSVLQDASLTVRLGSQVLAGTCSYLLALALLHRQRAERFISLIRSNLQPS